jgi:5,10-methylenetetrahydromethanopterin reductase
MQASGVPDSVLEDLHRLITWPATPEQLTEAARVVPDEVVQMLCAAGTPQECVEKVEEYVETGCTCPILYPLGPDVRLMIDTFAAAQ